MKLWKIGMLLILIIGAAILNFLPRQNYDYPIHVDEYVHIQYASQLTENTALYFPEERLNLEHGYHVLLGVLNQCGIDYLHMIKIMPALLMVLICLALFILTRRIFNENSAMFSVIFFVLLKSSASILGPMYLVPLSIGLFLILIGLFLLEKNSNIFALLLASLLIIHPPSAVAYFLVINIYLLINKKMGIDKIILQVIAFIISLPLYYPIFISKGAQSINSLSFAQIISPIFIPRFLGYFVIIFVVLGIYFSVRNKRYDLSVLALLFLIFALFTYRFNIEVIVPYARSLFYLFIIFAILFGQGINEFLLKFNDRLKVLAIILILGLLFSFQLPDKINSTNEFYQIMDKNDHGAFIWMKNNLPKGTIVVSDPWKANALTPFAGLEVYSRIVQGPSKKYEERNKEINEFFKGGCNEIDFLKKNNIGAVYGKCSNPLLYEGYPGVYLLR